MFRNLQLRTKLVILFLLLGLSPAFVIGGYTFYAGSENIEQEVYRSMEMFANLKEAELYDYFRQKENEGRVLASSEDVYQSLNLWEELDENIDHPEWEERTRIIDNYLYNALLELNLRQVLLTDQNGIVVYDTQDLMIGEDISKENHVQHALQQQRVFWSEIHYVELLDENCIALSIPVFSNGNSGSIVGTLNIMFSDEIITNFVHEGLDELGDTANAYLVDESGMLLTDTLQGDYTEDAALTEEIDTRATQILSNPIQEGDMGFEASDDYYDYQGNQVLGQMEVLRIGDNMVGIVVEVAQEEAFSGLEAMQDVIFTAMIIIAVIVIVIGVLIARGIAAPIKKVNDMAQEIANGDLTNSLDIKRGDEIGQLSTSFNTMGENLRGLIKQAVETATGVNNSSESVSSVAEEVTSSLQEISTTTNQFASNTQQLSDSAQKMNETSSEISEKAKNGEKVLDEVNSQMQNIKSEVENLSTMITRVNQRSQEIEKILSVITEIAEQTSLLSLNAAIEAARAGEHGQGFTVVAEEVRKLAEKSTQSASEIEKLVKHTQEDSSTAMESMKNGVAEVEEGAKVVSNSQEAFHEILTYIQEITGQVENVASASEELSSGSQEVAATIEEQSSTMEELAASSEELQSLAEKMFQELQKFKYE